MDLFDKFAQDMESFLSTNVQNISIKELWNQKPPVEAAGNTLEEWLHKDVLLNPFLFNLKFTDRGYIGSNSIIHILLLEENRELLQ